MRRALVEAGWDEPAIAAHLAKLPQPADELVELDADDEGKIAGLFLALDGSWHRAGMDGVRTGIIISEIAAAAALLPDVTVTPAMFMDLRKMEAEALRVFDSQRKRT